jgi:hypothetical protein
MLKSTENVKSKYIEGFGTRALCNKAYIVRLLYQQVPYVRFKNKKKKIPENSKTANLNLLCAENNTEPT